MINLPSPCSRHDLRLVVMEALDDACRITAPPLLYVGTEVGFYLMGIDTYGLTYMEAAEDTLAAITGWFSGSDILDGGCALGAFAISKARTLNITEIFLLVPAQIEVSAGQGAIGTLI